MKCPTCGMGDIEVERVTRAYDPLLPDIIADGLEHGVCAECGETISGFPRPRELDVLVLRAITHKTSPLAPNEIRFLRRSLGLRGVDLAARLAVGAEQVSRWENGKRPMPAMADRLLRMLVASHHELAAPDLAAIDHGKPAAPVRLELTLDQRWHAAEPRRRAAG